MKRALVIVDMQEGFLRDVDDARRSDLERSITRLITSGEYALVLASRSVNWPGSLHRKRCDWHEMGPGDPDVNLTEPVQTALHSQGEGASVADKPGYGLTREQVDSLSGMDEVDVCGVETDQCVLAVCLALFDAGIACRLLADLCSSNTPDAHDEAVAILQRLLGDGSVVHSVPLA